jgi:hypothetical protein
MMHGGHMKLNLMSFVQHFLNHLAKRKVNVINVYLIYKFCYSGNSITSPRRQNT